MVAQEPPHPTTSTSRESQSPLATRSQAAAHFRFGPRTATRSTTGRWDHPLRPRASSGGRRGIKRHQRPNWHLFWFQRRIRGHRCRGGGSVLSVVAVTGNHPPPQRDGHPHRRLRGIPVTRQIPWLRVFVEGVRQSKGWKRIRDRALPHSEIRRQPRTGLIRVRTESRTRSSSHPRRRAR